MPVHLLRIIRICAICEEVIRRRYCEAAGLGQCNCRWQGRPQTYVGEPTEDATGQHEDEREETQQVSGQQGTIRRFYPSGQVTLPR